MLLGKLIDERIFPQMRAKMEADVTTHAKDQRRRFIHASSLELKGYFLDVFLEGIRAGSKKEPTDPVLMDARGQLTSHTEKYVFNAELDFGPEVFRSIIDSIPSYLSALVTFGNCVVIDEAIHSYFAPTAKADHKLRHIPAKPHQDGLLTYVLCQRLHYSGRPISIAFAPTFLDESSSSRNTLVGMIVSLERAGIHPDLEWCIIADSLWSYPTYLSEFVALAWRFIVTAKENCTLVPQALRTLSQTDLVLGQARTYSDGFLTLQTYRSERGVSHILTNAVGVSHHDQNRSIPVLSYHTALSFFTRLSWWIKDCILTETNVLISTQRTAGAPAHWMGRSSRAFSAGQR